MYCPKCMAPQNEDAVLCERCGAPLKDASPSDNSDDMGQTMVIPVIKSGIRNTVSEDEPKAESKSAPRVQSRPVAARPKPTNKKNKSKNSVNKILVVVISFLIVLVLGLAIALAMVLWGNNSEPTSTPAETGGAVISNPEVLSEPLTEETSEETEAELVEGESEGTEEKTGINLDTAFEFNAEAALQVGEVAYKKLNSTEFGYECDIPSEFVFVSDANGEIRYRAEDRTAYMDIGAFANEDSLGCAEIKTMISGELGGAVEFDESGEDWFVMRTVSDGVVYCFKCYADEFIRYVEFVYPAEYREVYDLYSEGVEESFLRIN